MKIIYSFILVLTLIFKFCSPVLSNDQSTGFKNEQIHRAVNPLYDLHVTNFQLPSASGAGSNVLFFDIYIYHTNLFDSGPFEFSAGQYYFDFNAEIANGGTLSYSIVPNSTEFTNPDAVPINPTIVGNQLRLERNIDLGAGNGPIVSSISPGTRVVTMKLETSAPIFNVFNLNLVWRDSTSDNPYTKTFAYIGGISTDITSGATLLVDPIGVLPIELANFAASINRNNVLLNWSTFTETNNSGFDIERSVNNSQWANIGFTRGNGTSSTQNNYYFEDNNLNSGIYKYRLKQIDYNGGYEYFDLQTEVVVGIPNEFSLKQNYPNPFNPKTKIDFDIPVSGFVSLRVFDVTGRELKSLMSEFKNSGYYSIDFDASAFHSGAYFYRLESGNFTSTKKLVLLK